MAGMSETRRVEILTHAQQSNASINQLRAATLLLHNELKKLPQGSKEFLDTKAKWEEINKRFQTAQSEVRGVGNAMKEMGNKGSSAWGSIKAGMMGVLGGNLITNFMGVLNRMTFGVLDGTGKISDQMADIQRMTGMTTEEAKRLNDQLKQMDTRTSTSSLRDIAIVAGQLGVEKENIAGFVEALDKINVVMGGEFGGNAETVASEIGKLRNIFTDIKSNNIGEDLLHIGNAMNVLAQEGFATAPVMADFSSRIGGVGITLGLTTGQVLGLSATLQELNVNTERGGTAVTRILQYMSKNVDLFANVAGMGIREFTDLVNKDLFGAFTKVVEGAGKSADKATVLATTLDQLGVDGAGASEVIAKLSKNQDMLRDKVALASGALTQQDSIMSQFDQKNNTLGANLEKLGKAMANVWQNSAIYEGLNKMISAIVSTETETDKLINKFKDQEAQVKNLNNTIVPLLDRYDVLKAKTSLNKDEQAELKSIIEKVGEAIPGAVTQFGAYGEALDINAGKARQFVKDQALAMRSMNRDAIKSLEGDIQSATARRDQLLKNINTISGNKNLTDKDFSDPRSQWYTQGAKSKAQAVSNLREELKKLSDQIAEDNARLKQLRGDDLIERADAAAKAAEEAKKRNSTDTQDVETEAERKARLEREALEKKKEAADKKAAEKELKAQEDLLEKQFRMSLDYLDTWDNIEQTAIKQRYINGEITYEQYTAALEDQHMRMLEAQRITYQEYAKDDSRIAMQIADERVKQTKRAADAATAANATSSQIGAPGDFILGDTGLKSKPGDKPNAKKNDQYSWSDYGNQVMDLYGQAINLAKAREDAELAADKKIMDSRMEMLQQNLNAGLISQETYNKESEKLQAEYDDKRKEIQRKQWERQRAASIGEALINTAVAVTKALATGGPVAGPIMAALIGASGALQIASIASQPVPEFAEGGYSDMTGSSGRRYKARRGSAGNYYSSPTYIVGETGNPEYVVPSWLVRHPAAANLMGALEATVASKNVGYLQAGGAGNAELLAAVQKLNANLSGGIHASMNWDEVGYTRYKDTWDQAERLGKFG